MLPAIEELPGASIRRRSHGNAASLECPAGAMATTTDAADSEVGIPSRSPSPPTDQGGLTATKCIIRVKWPHGLGPKNAKDKGPA